jgi:hypothetical protein
MRCGCRQQLRRLKSGASGPDRIESIASALPGERPEDEVLQRVQPSLEPRRRQDGSTSQASRDEAGVLKSKGIERHPEKMLTAAGERRPRPN